MGVYCTVRDVRLALTPGADSADTETAAGLQDWQLEDAISESEGVVNLHVLTRYTIPSVEETLDPPEDDPDQGPSTYNIAPFPVRGWTRDVAAFLATLTYRKNKDLPQDDPIRLRYQMSLNMLVAIRDGQMDIPGFPPTEDSGVGITVENQYDGKLWGPEDFGLGPAGVVNHPQVYWPLYHG